MATDLQVKRQVTVRHAHCKLKDRPRFPAFTSTMLPSGLRKPTFATLRAPNALSNAHGAALDEFYQLTGERIIEMPGEFAGPTH